MQHCHMVIPPYDPEKMVKLALDADGGLTKDLSEEFSQDSADGDIDIGEVL